MRIGINMDKKVSATEAVRKFSEIMNSVKYKGENYTIVRGGKPVAAIRPVESSLKVKSLIELEEMLKVLPKLGDEAHNFERDFRKILENQPSLPKKSPWD